MATEMREMRIVPPLYCKMLFQNIIVLIITVFSFS